MPEATNPDMQVKLFIGELVITIAHLEAQKADLVQQLAAAVAANVLKPEATD